MDDTKIVDLYLLRCESALEETAKKYGAMLYSISHNLLDSDGDAKECVSDTYLAAWQTIPPQNPLYLGAYLARIVRRISTDRYRYYHREKRGGIAAVCEELDESVTGDDDIDSFLDSTALTEAINEFLGSLGSEKRNIFVLRYYFAYPVCEIAKRLGVGEGKVKSILFRLRSDLGVKLKKEGLM